MSLGTPYIEPHGKYGEEWGMEEIVYVSEGIISCNQLPRRQHRPSRKEVVINRGWKGSGEEM